MRIGDKKHRVTIQSFTTAKDSIGHDVETWANGATVWASVRPLQGNERFRAQQVNADLSHRVQMRYRSGLRARDRLSWDDAGSDRTLEIVSVFDVDERKRELELLCKEAVD